MSIELPISEALQLKERDIFDGKTCKTLLKIPFILDWIALQVREVGLKCFLCLSRVKVLSPALALLCCQGNSSSPCHALSDPCMFTVLSFGLLGQTAGPTSQGHLPALWSRTDHMLFPASFVPWGKFRLWSLCSWKFLYNFSLSDKDSYSSL